MLDWRKTSQKNLNFIYEWMYMWLFFVCSSTVTHNERYSLCLPLECVFVILTFYFPSHCYNILLQSCNYVYFFYQNSKINYKQALMIFLHWYLSFNKSSEWASEQVLYEQTRICGPLNHYLPVLAYGHSHLLKRLMSFILVWHLFIFKYYICIVTLY